MAIVDFFDGGEKRQVKGHISNLIKVSLVDGVTADETALLEKISKKMGLIPEELEQIKADPDAYAINPPTELEDKYKRLYHLVQMMLTDGFADDAEVRIIGRYGIGIGIPSEKLKITISQMIGYASKNMSVDEVIAMILD